MVAPLGPRSSNQTQATLAEPLQGPGPRAHNSGERVPEGTKQLIFNVTWVPGTTGPLMSHATRGGLGTQAWVGENTQQQALVPASQPPDPPGDVL